RHTRFSRDWSSDVCSSDLRGEIIQGKNHAHEPVIAGGIVSRTEFQRHLILLAEIERFHVLPFTKIPNMEPAAIAASKQDLGIDEIGRAACRERAESAEAEG